MQAGEAEVAFRSGEARIFGTLRAGSGRGRRPLAILVHGFGSFRDELTGFVELAERLAASGIASLRLDMRGCGKSGTRGLMHPMWDWVEDIRNAVSFAETLPDVDGTRSGIVGMSMGGGVAVITAAVDPRLKVVSALAPVGDGEAWFRHLWVGTRGTRGWRAFQDELAEDRRTRAVKGRSRVVSVLDAMAYAPGDRRAFLAMSKTYPAFLKRLTLSSVESAMLTRAVPAASLIAPRPLLIVHSRADSSVPVEQAEALAAAAGEPCRLVLLDHSPHCFWIGNDSIAVQEETSEWLRQHL
jgi:pimeloyl-ACP methyl ester carboxylesterase